MGTRTRQRAGAVLAVALICLLLVMMFTGAVVRALVLRQRSVRTEERQLQSFWLAESGLARAIARSRADAEYTGESWQVSLIERGTEVSARVRIQVTTQDGDERRRRVQVEARVPEGTDAGVVSTRELSFSVPGPTPN